MQHPYNEILNLNTGPVRYDLHPLAKVMKLTTKDFPWSINQFEFDILRSIISSCNLKSGLEIGTGFGISAIAAGLGFKETNGKLVTIDSYIEEQQNSYTSYRRALPSLFHESTNYQSVRHLIDHFQLHDTVYPEIGWSPRDTATILRKTLGPDCKLDYVFLDGGEFPEQVVKDVESFLPFLNEKYIILFQGMFPNVYDVPVLERITKVTGVQPVLFNDPSLPFTSRLGVVYKS